MNEYLKRARQLRTAAESVGIDFPTLLALVLNYGPAVFDIILAIVAARNVAPKSKAKARAKTKKTK